MQPVVSDIRRVAEGAQKPSGHGTWTLKAQAPSGPPGLRLDWQLLCCAAGCAKAAQTGLVVLKQLTRSLLQGLQKSATLLCP